MSSQLFDVKTEWMPFDPSTSNPDVTIVGIDYDNDCMGSDIECYIGKLFNDKDH